MIADDEALAALVGLEAAWVRVLARPDIDAVEVVIRAGDGPDGTVEAFLISTDGALHLALALARASAQRPGEGEL